MKSFEQRGCVFLFVCFLTIVNLDKAKKFNYTSEYQNLNFYLDYHGNKG